MATRVQKKSKIILPANFKPKIGVVQATYNKAITDQQLQGVIKCCQEYNVAYQVVRVPGSFEIPYILAQLARSRRHDGLVAIGCLIKGETMHFEVLAHAVTQALMNISVQQKIPVGFGVITALTKSQAKKRVFLGYDAAYAVIAALAVTKKH